MGRPKLPPHVPPPAAGEAMRDGDVTPEDLDADSTPIGGRAIGDRPFGRFLMTVLWPSFGTAVVAVGLFFSMVDPHELIVVGVHLADDREAAYTIGFFLFWALFAFSSALTWVLMRSGAASPPTPLLRNDDDRRHRDKALIGR